MVSTRGSGSLPRCLPHLYSRAGGRVRLTLLHGLHTGHATQYVNFMLPAGQGCSCALVDQQEQALCHSSQSSTTL